MLGLLGLFGSSPGVSSFRLETLSAWPPAASAPSKSSTLVRGNERKQRNIENKAYRGEHGFDPNEVEDMGATETIGIKFVKDYNTSNYTKAVSLKIV